ncbi:DUF4344 domain-containing metallopeptidase [Mycolicibacterium sp. 050158]|uniref:DUF4344 domain-containing metallopeptidase n=1 Tax=Mycolicibacterium sp. 050158 TaxID=3090602 RepID=UPI00299E78D6|nr:DUF4344 domain-containing metallopeptidase [Mycolicibacterium sp. 050158]MDX1893200.1 DUF4344 domain-containing metallopeptidase [Mycolicibacterium sp. 050158]
MASDFRVGLVGVVAALTALGVVTAGCGHRETPAGPAPSTMEVSTAEIAAPTPTQTDVNGNGKPDGDPSDEDWPGKMTVVYEDATTPDAIRGRKLMQDANLLPQLADDINATLKLPYDIPLKGSQCDEPNDFWSPSDQAMTMCYEDVANSLDIYRRLGDEDPEQGAFNEAMAAFYHETGHMVIDVYQLPALGREEDVADQASVYLLMRPDDEGNYDKGSVQAVLDSARWFEAMNDDDGGWTDPEMMADPHSPDKARMYDMVCWVYGADPDDTGDVVAAKLLPEQRAEQCGFEYQKLDRAWSTLLHPYLK